MSAANETFYYKRAEDCPKADKHTPSPGGYLSWNEWAVKKAKTHTQHQCATCGFWAIWKPKKRATVSPGGGAGT